MEVPQWSPGAKPRWESEDGPKKFKPFCVWKYKFYCAIAQKIMQAVVLL